MKYGVYTKKLRQKLISGLTNFAKVVEELEHWQDFDRKKSHLFIIRNVVKLKIVIIQFQLAYCSTPVGNTCISENVGMYRKLYKQVFNTNPTLFVMLSITCEAQYWNRHLSVTNYCNILLCSHIHVRVYICTLLAVSITTGKKDRTRETNKSCLKWRHLRTVRSQASDFLLHF